MLHEAVTCFCGAQRRGERLFLGFDSSNDERGFARLRPIGRLYEIARYVTARCSRAFAAACQPISIAGLENRNAENAARFSASHSKCALDALKFTLKVPRGSGQHLRLSKPGHLFRGARLLLFRNNHAPYSSKLMRSSSTTRGRFITRVLMDMTYSPRKPRNSSCTPPMKKTAIIIGA